MKRGFTLIELLVVMGIIGLMGMIAVNGYRAITRGMEERSAIQNSNQFIRSAYQRAQIDRQPVAVYFWNETLREETDDESLVVRGKAVAVRRVGRITKVQGSYLYDEFGDLRFNRLILDEDAERNGLVNGSASDTGNDSGVYLYPVNGNEGNNVRRSVVRNTTQRKTQSEPLLLGKTRDGKMSAVIESYAYVLMDKNGVDWKTGDAYGVEFATIELPDGYIFGSDYSEKITTKLSGEQVMRFSVSSNNGSGARGGIEGQSTITICSLMPNKSGKLQAQAIGTTDSPIVSLRQSQQ